MSCFSAKIVALPACPHQIHLVDSGLNEAVDYYVKFTDKFGNMFTTLIEAPFASNDIVIPIEFNADIPEGLFSPYSGLVKMEIYDSTFQTIVPFNVTGTLENEVLLDFQNFEGALPPTIIHGA